MAADERGRYTSIFSYVRSEIGSSQGHNLALDVLYVPHLLDSGTWDTVVFV